MNKPRDVSRERHQPLTPNHVQRNSVHVIAYVLIIFFMLEGKMSFICTGTTSNTLLWRELRRQRELQEQKLKKRKERLMLERKGRRSGLENASEDEGFGRSTLSADITTATWGGSTQMSSTQNDSAVSEGSSHDSDEEVVFSFSVCF